MSVAFPVSDIIERVRSRCGLPTFTTETNITTADILSFVQESARALGGLLEDESWHFVTTTTLYTVADFELVSLPVNTASIIALHWDRGDGSPVPVRMANLETARPATSEPAGWDACAPTYRLVGQTIELFPVPTAVESLVLRYSTGLFVADASDTIMGQVEWDSWVIYDCCCKVRERQEKDPGTFVGERAVIEQRLVRRARKRDRGGVRQVRDVRGALVGAAMQGFEWWKL